MYLLGISEIDSDAGAVLLRDSTVICGMNEERLSRIKLHQGFPHRSIDWILKSSNLSLQEIDYIAVAKADPVVNPHLFFRVRELLQTHDYFSKDDPSSWWAKGLNLAIHRFRNAPRSISSARRMSREIQDWAVKNRCTDKIIRVPHHPAHAACAYWASGFEEALVVTLDGQGEGVTSQIYWVQSGQFKLLKETFMPHSLGIFYAAVTKALGFTPNRHEGKVTGLAAYANPEPRLLNEVRKLAFNDGEGSFKAPSIYGNYPKILRLAQKYGREQMASAFQQVLEEVAVRYIASYVEKTRAKNMALAGGVFANVKLNQRIHQIPGIENIFIFPHMADGGLGYGAAQMVYRSKTNDRTPNPIRDVYWGPEYTNQEIESALKRHRLPYSYSEDIAVEIAELLAQNKVVGLFNGRMEFGPRALGNRSIFYPATDPKVNEWLNKQLQRSEFMPFAPVTLAEEAPRCYEGLEGAQFTAEFMTITFDCTEEMKSQSPAVVHVDGTARPQLISESTNPRYYRILKEYFKRTGIPSVVNTSFNMHEEPIVGTPDDAIRAFLLGHLNYLAIGDFLVTKKQQELTDSSTLEISDELLKAPI